MTELIFLFSVSPQSFALASHRSLSKQIADLRGEVILTQQMIGNLIRGSNPTEDQLDLEEDNRIQLPVQSYEEFLEFDSKLKNDEKYRTQFVSISVLFLCYS